MAVNEAAWKILSANGKSIDAVEAGAMQIEDTINCCVGLGGYPDRDGIVTLDACIMDGPTHRCGSVAAVEQIATARPPLPRSIGRRRRTSTPPSATRGAVGAAWVSL